MSKEKELQFWVAVKKEWRNFSVRWEEDGDEGPELIFYLDDEFYDADKYESIKDFLDKTRAGPAIFLKFEYIRMNDESLDHNEFIKYANKCLGLK